MKMKFVLLERRRLTNNNVKAQTNRLCKQNMQLIKAYRDDW